MLDLGKNLPTELLFWSYFFSFLAVSDTFLALSSTFFYIVWNIIGIYMHSRYGCATETDDFTTYSDILIRDVYTAVIINFSQCFIKTFIFEMSNFL